jgi:carbonic anhydrase
LTSEKRISFEMREALREFTSSTAFPAEYPPVCSKEALRSIVISQRLLGTREVAVFHHTDCGMLTFTTEQLKKIVKDAAPSDSKVAEEVDKLDFLEFPELEQSVKDDVEFLSKNPLLLKETKITGWTYDVRTGKVCPWSWVLFRHSAQGWLML